MQILLEGQEALDYISYMQSQAKSFEEVETIANKYGKIKLPSIDEVAEPNRERHRVETQKDIADDIMSEVEQATVDVRKVPSQFPTTPVRKHHKWTVSDIHTLHVCATDPRPSIRKLTYIHSRFDMNNISMKAISSKLRKLGYNTKKGIVCLHA